MDYYTLQIHYGDSLKPTVTEMKDLDPGTLDFKAWSRELRKNLFTTGFNLETTPGNYEMINPFRIHKAFLLKQDRKYAV